MTSGTLIKQVNPRTRGVDSVNLNTGRWADGKTPHTRGRWPTAVVLVLHRRLKPARWG